MMKCDWDEEKNETNIIKHGFDFERASTIFEGVTLDRVDERFDYGELRTISIGLMESTTIVTVVHTDRLGVRRIISARQANRLERRLYETYQTEVRRRTGGNE